MEPPPPNGYLISLQEEATSQEEESCGCNDDSIACDVTRYQRTNKHHIRIGGDKGGIKDNPEVEEASSQVK